MHTQIDSFVSKRIDALRFLLIVLVVFIHNNITEVNFAGSSLIVAPPPR
ncbi:MAG: hypothetical protein ACTTIC_06830 [Helicobacteraceae bacterium]